MIVLLISGFAGVLLCVLVMAFGGKLCRSEEVSCILPNSMEKSVEWAGTVSGVRDWELLAACMESLAVSIDSDSALAVRVMKADGEKGMLSVKLQEKFRHPNGGEDAVWEERTALLDRCIEEETAQYEVRFYRNREITGNSEAAYKVYVVKEGGFIVPPVNPTEETAVFVEWRDINDYIADFAVPVTENRIYYAVWR